MREFPLDIPSVFELGLEKWRGALSWPVSWNRFLRIEQDTKEVLNGIIRESSNSVADLLLISYKIYIEHANLIHAFCVLQELERQGKRTVVADNNDFYGVLLDGRPPVKSLFDRSLFKGVAANGVRRTLKRNLRTLKNNLMFSPLHFVPKILSCNSYALDSGGALAEFVTARERERILFREPERWYSQPSRTAFADSETAEFRAAADKIAAGIADIAAKHGVHLPGCVKDYISNSTRSALEKTAILLRGLEQRFAGRKPVDLFLGSNRTVFLRALSLAARRNGGSVTGFMHGEPLVYEWDKLAWLEFPFDDRFYTYTESIARELRDTSGRFAAPNGRTPEICGQGTRRFSNISVGREVKGARENRRVMIVPNCFTLSDILSQASSFPEIMQFQIENTLVGHLQQAGFEVLYKKHPDGTLRGQRFTLFPNVEVVYERFEEVMQLADSFLFYHTRTSTFGPALCTDKPIVIIDGGWEKINLNMLALLKKRCSFVKATVSEQNQVVINPSELKDALHDYEKAANTEFRETYLV
jgi:hypothetical protein